MILRRAVYVTVDGPDRSGKDILANGLKRKMEDRGRVALVFHDPCETELGRHIHGLANAERQTGRPICPGGEATLLLAATVILHHQCIIPNLDVVDLIVVVDSPLTAMVYHAYQRLLDGRLIELIRQLEGQGVSGVRPDIGFRLTCSPEVAESRQAAPADVDRLLPPPMSDEGGKPKPVLDEAETRLARLAQRKMLHEAFDEVYRQPGPACQYLVISTSNLSREEEVQVAWNYLRVHHFPDLSP